MCIQKYGPWICERNPIKTNTSIKQNCVYYAPYWQRTKHICFTHLFWHGHIDNLNKNNMWDTVLKKNNYIAYWRHPDLRKVFFHLLTSAAVLKGSGFTTQTFTANFPFLRQIHLLLSLIFSPLSHVHLIIKIVNRFMKMEVDDGGRWNIVGNTYNGDNWLCFTNNKQ